MLDAKSYKAFLQFFAQSECKIFSVDLVGTSKLISILCSFVLAMTVDSKTIEEWSLFGFSLPQAITHLDL